MVGDVIKPLGRKHYKDKTGGKINHKIREPNLVVWWEKVCTPSKTLERRRVSKEIKQEIDACAELAS